jgi:hypothetical protein
MCAAASGGGAAAFPGGTVCPRTAVPLFSGLTFVVWGEFECPPKNTTYNEVLELAALGDAAEVVTEITELTKVPVHESIAALNAALVSGSCVGASGDCAVDGGETRVEGVVPAAQPHGAWFGVVSRALGRHSDALTASAAAGQSLAVPPLVVLCDEPHFKLPQCLLPLLGSAAAEVSAASGSAAPSLRNSSVLPASRPLVVMVRPEWILDCVATISLLDPYHPHYLHSAMTTVSALAAGATLRDAELAQVCSARLTQRNRR